MELVGLAVWVLLGCLAVVCYLCRRDPRAGLPLLGPGVPAALPLGAFLAGDREVVGRFVKNMEAFECAVFDLEDDQAEALATYKIANAAFFELPLVQKRKHRPLYELGSDGEMFRARPANIGYIHYPGLKEYLKLKARYGRPDKAVPFPSDAAFQPAFEGALRVFSDTAWAAMRALIAAEPGGLPTGFPRSHRYSLEDLRRGVENSSGLACINYFARHDPPGSEYFSSKPHRDSGTVTIILATEVPGLEVFDVPSASWIAVERSLLPGRQFLVQIGRQMSTHVCSSPRKRASSLSITACGYPLALRVRSRFTTRTFSETGR